MKETTHRILWYVIFCICLILIVLTFFRISKQTEYYKEYIETKKNITELELTRYYLINGFCNAYNFSEGFKPLGEVKDNLSVQCMDCSPITGRCGKTKMFILK